MSFGSWGMCRWDANSIKKFDLFTHHFQLAEVATWSLKQDFYYKL